MTHKTKGIVLRTVKYGETSLIATIFTELFGIQSYLINGVRKSQAKMNKQIMLQSSAILEMEVYHNELKSLQRIKEYNWETIYEKLLTDVTRNSISTYLIELLLKTLKQPEANPDFFYFCEDVFKFLDRCNIKSAANLPLYFSLQLTRFLGCSISNPPIEFMAHQETYLDLKEGIFVNDRPLHKDFIEGTLVQYTIELMKVIHPEELEEIPLNKEIRRALLNAYQNYFSYHFSDFGNMKTLKLFQEVLS